VSDPRNHRQYPPQRLSCRPHSGHAWSPTST
jgi:hypothetical protein